MRIKILRGFVAFLFSVIVLGLLYHQVIQGWYYYKLSVNNHIRVVSLEGKRGNILDRNGLVLAENRLGFNVMLTPQEIENDPEVFGFLSRVLKVDEPKLRERYLQGRYAPFAPVMIAEDVPREVAFTIEENRFRLPSIFIEENYIRNYPYGEANAHVLGYVGKISQPKVDKLKDYGYTVNSIIGYSGIEEFYDAYLRGADGGVQLEVNSRGQQVRLLGYREPQQGKDLVLTIDNRIQTAAYDLLKDQPGTIIVMDKDTGEVLAMTNSPSYDPHVFVSVADKRDAELLFSNPQSPLLNRAIKGQFPPGSVFKIPIAIGALHAGKIQPSTSFLCVGYFSLGKRKVACSHVHGTQDLLQAITHSCNVYFNNVGLLIGPELINKYERIFGLGRKTDIDLPYEEAGFIPSPAQRATKNRGWYKGDTVNFSIGQGEVLVTPLQLVRMMSAVAQNGKLVQPHLVKMIEGKPLNRYTLPTYININPKIFDIVHKGLEAVVADPTGTAHHLYIEGMTIAGKTGTAQTSGNKPHHSWFVGYTKTDKLNIAFCVFLEHGGSSYYAARMAHDFLMRLRAEQIL